MTDREVHPLVAKAVAGCCGNDAWRGQLCSYHQGYADGVHALIEDELREYHADRQAEQLEVDDEPTSITGDLPTFFPDGRPSGQTLSEIRGLDDYYPGQL